VCVCVKAAVQKHEEEVRRVKEAALARKEVGMA